MRWTPPTGPGWCTGTSSRATSWSQNSGSARGDARGDHVYLTDFGLTKRTTELSGGLTGTGHFLGTVDYVSPEQIQGKPVGPGTDIYALGCVLYECLTGQPPFRRDDDAALLWAHLVETPPPVTGIRPEVPEAVDAVVARAMAKDPADRYESCEELVHELEAALGCRRPCPRPTGGQGHSPEAARSPPAGGDDEQTGGHGPLGTRTARARRATASRSTSARASSPPRSPTTAGWRCSRSGTARW